VRRQTIISGVAVVFVLAAAVIWRATRPKPQTADEKHDPNLVELSLEAQKNAGIVTALTAERRLQGKVSTTGVISPDEARVAHITPLSQGVVESVLVQLGDRVQKGQPLLVYDNIELGESISQYQTMLGGLQKAMAQEQVAKRSLERAKSLIEVQAISPREFDLRNAEYEQAKAGVESQRAEVTRVEEKLHRFGLTDEDLKRLDSSEHGTHRTASHNTLRAPLSGVVTKYDVSKGEVVGRDKELFTIVDTSTVWALADVYEKDIQYVARGGECRVALASYPNDLFTGQITYLSDALDPASRTAKLRCVLANKDGRVKLEMFAAIEIPGAKSRTLLAVPRGAVLEINGAKAVFVPRDRTHFEKKLVRTGEQIGDWIEVAEGLAPGERVVTNGGFYLKSVLLKDQLGGEE